MKSRQNTIFLIIRKNAEAILESGPEKSYSEDLRARQIEAAKQAVALLTDQRN